MWEDTLHKGENDDDDDDNNHCQVSMKYRDLKIYISFSDC
jgi:hypothetical protein